VPRISGKIALITGGAGGLGEAIVRLLVREGAKVVITDVQDAAGQAVADAVGADQALYLHHDVASEADWQSVIARTLDHFGQLDVVVNQVVFLGPDNTIREEFHLKRGHVRKLEQFGFASRVAETRTE
jgi:3(or 17)beta-hydroxysteroid dehydrogenase